MTVCCPGRIGQPYVYNNWYLLFFLDDCLLSWIDWTAVCIQQLVLIILLDECLLSLLDWNPIQQGQQTVI
jgi:hypothetical protein